MKRSKKWATLLLSALMVFTAVIGASGFAEEAPSDNAAEMEISTAPEAEVIVEPEAVAETNNIDIELTDEDIESLNEGNIVEKTSENVVVTYELFSDSDPEPGPTTRSSNLVSKGLKTTISLAESQKDNYCYYRTSFQYDVVEDTISKVWVTNERPGFYSQGSKGRMGIVSAVIDDGTLPQSFLQHVVYNIDGGPAYNIVTYVDIRVGAPHYERWNV